MQSVDQLADVGVIVGRPHNCSRLQRRRFKQFCECGTYTGCTPVSGTSSIFDSHFSGFEVANQ